jgi:hypothetical protein
MDGPLGHVEYDSRSGTPPTGPSTPIVQALSDQLAVVREVTYAPDGTMRSMEPPMPVQSNLSGGFPSGPLEPGATWEREGTVTIPSGTMKSHSRFLLKEVVTESGRRVARIEVTMSGVMERDPSSPLAGRVGPMPLESTGEILFDVDRGRLIRSLHRQAGTMTVMEQSLQTTSETLVELITP